MPKNNNNSSTKDNKKNQASKNQLQRQSQKKQSQTLKSKFNEKKDTGIVEGVFIYTEPLTIGDFALKIGKTSAEIVKIFFKRGLMVNQNAMLTEEQMGELALEFGYDFKKEEVVSKENFFNSFKHDDNPEDLKVKPPVVTIMGHVDHGKTTLLDSIRNTHVVDGEFGGITQHIGAYQVNLDGKKITFIDTPGHEAFTEMRARGSEVTDIVILVVAADDGIMPQTEEAIDHAKAANVPIIVFVNKIDKPGSDPDKVKTELMRFNIVAEEFGGDIPFVEGSAKQKMGINSLLETIYLIAEINKLCANPNRYANGTVIEAHLDKNKGPVATVLVQGGTLKIKDIVVAGGTYGTIKDMQNERGAKVKEVIPSEPVQIIGLNDVPRAGDKFIAIPEEKIARQIAQAQAEKLAIEERSKRNTLSLDAIKAKIEEGSLKTLGIIIKADTQGTAEAVRSSLQKINIDGVRLDIIRATVGAISASDVTLATASKSIVYGFNVRPTAQVRQKAEDDGVDIRLHTIIYKMIEELEQAAKGLLDPVFEEQILGELQVRQIFKHSAVGTIAGCHVTNGTIPRGSKVRIIRDGVVIYTGELSSLKHVKDDVKEVKVGMDCGLTIKNFNDIKENDIIEAYKIEEVK
ncbi:translation initiation factor IF-2 [Spiroplasma endosymbiont of Labia minor]|uniref:translation initiation factor IF-2 n=1 Tax=Spiroplasma endosymbiont of Labia minor TaxID=3066305 RepID=UPI0030CBD03C